MGVAGCKLLWTSLYDDFISFSQPACKVHRISTVVSLFKLLGWTFAEEGDKCVPFSEKCEALGVRFTLKDSAAGQALVQHASTRIDELCADLLATLNEGLIGPKTVKRLRGRMQFAEAQLFGRIGPRCLNVLTDFAKGRRNKLLPRDRMLIGLFVQLIRCNISRAVDVRAGLPPPLPIASGCGFCCVAVFVCCCFVSLTGDSSPGLGD